MIGVYIIDAKNSTDLELFATADAQTIDEFVKHAFLFCFKQEFRREKTAAGV